MKKILCTSLIAFLLLSGNATYVKAQTITSGGKNAEVYTSSDASDTSNVKTTVSASFIKDPNDSNLTALISVKGFIPSKLTKYGGYYNGFMDWTSQYDMIIESIDENKKVKILESIPHNQIEKVNVKETMGYSIGGNISISNSSSNTSESGGVNGNYSFQRSIEYQQPDFKTIQKADGLTKAAWSLIFNKTKDGYDRDSYNILYGNQLFMKSRYQNTGIKNLVDDKDLSSLISGGFTPDIVTALKAPKDMEKSIFTVTYKIYQDLYSVKWTGTEWWGSNMKAWDPSSITHTYELDWKNNTVKLLE